jgi:long-subunit fatty acid transport protein
MKNKVIYMAVALLLPGLLSAQNEVDALRYSLSDFSGSARSLGMGGAFGALGADFSSFTGNPAGIGMYKRGTFEFGFGINNTETSSRYENGTAKDDYPNFLLNNIGVVASGKTKHPDWTVSNFGIAYVRTQDFNQNIQISGDAFNTTLLDVFAAQAAAIHPDDITDAVPFTAGLAYQTYLINPSDENGTFYTPEFSGGSVRQAKRINRQGRGSETSFAYGAAYQDRLYFGVGLGFVGTRFTEESHYTESNFEEDEDLSSWTYNEDLKTRGTGLNVKVGMIARIQEWLRAGVAVHSPTYLSLADSYSSVMNSYFRNGDDYSWESPLGSFNYSLRTPARYMANLAFVLGKAGIISADYEFTDYSTARLRSSGTANDYDFDAENQAIQDIYRGSHMVKAGVEFRVGEAVRLRTGAAYRQSPFVNGTAINSPEILYSGGAGWRKDSFSIDVSLAYQDRDESYYLYDPSVVSETKLDKTKWIGMVSIGFRY